MQVPVRGQVEGAESEAGVRGHPCVGSEGEEQLFSSLAHLWEAECDSLANFIPDTEPWKWYLARPGEDLGVESMIVGGLLGCGAFRLAALHAPRLCWLWEMALVRLSGETGVAVCPEPHSLFPSGGANPDRMWVCRAWTSGSTGSAQACPVSFLPPVGVECFPVGGWCTGTPCKVTGRHCHAPPGGAVEEAEGTSGERCKTVPGHGGDTWDCDKCGHRAVTGKPVTPGAGATCDPHRPRPHRTTAGLEGGGHLGGDALRKMGAQTVTMEGQAERPEPQRP